VALYFGTFNPMHKGHLSILRHLAASGFDAVKMIVSPESPFKRGADATAEERLDKVRAKVAELGLPVEVDDVEFHLPRPNYTINTLRHLSEENPDTDFVIAMGADNIAGIEGWREWESIVGGYEIWVYPRKGYDVAEKCASLGVKYIDAPLVNISSSDIRAGKADKDLMI